MTYQSVRETGSSATGDPPSPSRQLCGGSGGPTIWEPALDGVTDGYNIFQGVRNYDPALGTWSTPDAYQGDVGDPMSQHAYMWNRNNSFLYADPTGYYTFNFGSYWTLDLSEPPEQEAAGPPSGQGHIPGVDDDEDSDSVEHASQGYRAGEQADTDKRLNVPKDAPRFRKNALPHIFQNKQGHFKVNSAAARSLIRRAAAEGRVTRLGEKSDQTEHRTWVDPASRSTIWVDLYKGEIYDAGIVQPPAVP